MSDLGHLPYFLVIEVCSTANGFTPSVRKYLLEKFQGVFPKTNISRIFLLVLLLLMGALLGLPWSAMFTFVLLMVTVSDLTRYHHLDGSLVYQDVTSPGISNHVHIFRQFVSAATLVHYSHLLHDLRGMISHCLFFPCSSSLQLQAYSNATWASDPWDCSSLSVYCVFLVVLSLPLRQRNRLVFHVRVSRLSRELWLF